jgi:aminoglycoside/choline kinase family phosphotransferase/dTDP-glucose pyrophosphorylase
MKALILSAGYGTRLRPHTETLPKALFPVGGIPLIDRIIEQLKTAGCESIMINTHHLHELVESHVNAGRYGIPVMTCHETEILGTGGAIKNVSGFWDKRPFFVVNSDIVTDIDFKEVYGFHLDHRGPVTLVLKDHPQFNLVSVSPDGSVVGFDEPQIFAGAGRLAFTGIQVIDPWVLKKIPAGRFISSIDIYRNLIAEGQPVRAFIDDTSYWQDIGTAERYRGAVLDCLVPEAFRRAFSMAPGSGYVFEALSGDGSDRRWLRVSGGSRSLVVADYGIQGNSVSREIESFSRIGHHLRACGIPVPRIFLEDHFSGLVFLEDLGDLSLQAKINEQRTSQRIMEIYRLIVDMLVDIYQKASPGFDVKWTYQTTYYDRDLILEKECRYFIDAFINGFCNRGRRFEDFDDEFNLLAAKAVDNGYYGFMHRDFQSRNIMVRNGQFYAIDFQGARWGPVQYDLASLLIDPYVALPMDIQEALLDHFIRKTAGMMEPGKFRTGYTFCATARNLQILGAFSFLSTVRGKRHFEPYIPVALATMRSRLSGPAGDDLPKLKALVESLSERVLHHDGPPRVPMRFSG